MAASLQMTRVYRCKRKKTSGRVEIPTQRLGTMLASLPSPSPALGHTVDHKTQPAAEGDFQPGLGRKRRRGRISAPKVANHEGFKKNRKYDIFHLPLNSALRAGSTQTQARLAAAGDSFPSWKMETGGGSLAQLRRHIEGDGGARWS